MAGQLPSLQPTGETTPGSGQDTPPMAAEVYLNNLNNE